MHRLYKQQEVANRPRYPFDPIRKPRKAPVKTDKSWLPRWYAAHYKWHEQEYPQAHRDGHYSKPTLSKKKKDHDKLEENASNYIKWIGGVATQTPTVGMPRFETQLVGGKGTRVQVGWLRAKGGTGKQDTDILYKGVNFKVDWKVGNDTQSEEQYKYQKRIEAAGGLYFLMSSLHDLYAVIDRIDNGESLKGELF